MTETLATEPASLASHRGQSSYRADVDGIRAVAVALVVAFHAKVAGFTGGFVGVDVFFVISGYLISGIIWQALDKREFSFGTFYRRRIRRIFPSLVLVLAVTALLGWLFLFSPELVQLGKHVVGGATFLSNFVLVRETGYFDSPEKPLLHLWSLAVEGQFYLIWPLTAFVVWKTGRNPRWTLIALIEISFLANVWMVRHSMASTSFYSPVSRFWEILAGALLCDVQRRPLRSRAWLDAHRRLLSELASMTGAGLIVAAVLSFDQATPWPGIGGLLPVIGTCFLISAGRDATLNRFLLSHPAVVAIGLISYPLYLWHWPLLVFADLINEGPPAPLVRVAMVGIALLLAYWTYQVVEKPIRFGRAKRRAVPFLLTGLLASGVVGFLFWSSTVNARIDSSAVAHLKRWGPARDVPGGTLVNNEQGLAYFRLPGATADTVVILGDSHAEQYWPRIVQLAGERKGHFPTVVLITYGSCPPMPGVNQMGSSWQHNAWHCDVIHREAIRYVMRPGVTKVVFIAFWEAYLRLNTLYLTDDPEKRVLTETGPGTDRLFSNFESELELLRSANKQIFFVLSNPTIPDRNLDSKWPRRVVAFGDQVKIPDISRSEFQSGTALVNAKLTDIARRQGITLIDPAEFLCGSATCPTMTSDSMPIFFDNNHLRSGFVQRRAVFIDRIFDGS